MSKQLTHILRYAYAFCHKHNLNKVNQCIITPVAMLVRNRTDYEIIQWISFAIAIPVAIDVLCFGFLSAEAHQIILDFIR